MEATLVAPVVTANDYALADELRRDALFIEVRCADVMREVPAARVYVFCLERSLAHVLGERIVQWAAGRAGLIGLVPDGGGNEREALLSFGFDDAVGRLSARELSARIRAVDRRLRQAVSSTRMRFGAFTLDIANRKLWTQGRGIALTSTELEVMRALMMARGRPLSRGDLLDAVWGDADLEVSERAVDNVILRLRRKLANAESLETVRGVGFRLG
jgi:DNA-binding response OmpR family regulator